MPDKHTREEDFRDYKFASRAISAIEQLSKKKQSWMVGVGFKLPHLALHVPFKYFDLYSKKGSKFEEAVSLKDDELKFPPTSPEVAYKCCAADTFVFQKKEGSEKSFDAVQIGNINEKLPGK
jgi:hypothetical protein